jgi:hypothetical protein
MRIECALIFQKCLKKNSSGDMSMGARRPYGEKSIRNQEIPGPSAACDAEVERDKGR